MPKGLKRLDLFVLYTFCHDYHSGQWSRGYRILSRIHTWAKGNVRMTEGCMADCRETEQYMELVEKYADKM